MAAGDKKASQFTAIATLASSDTFVAVDTSESDLRTATGTVVLAWIGASLDMSTIASGGALPVAYGGSGRATGTTAYSLLATGTTATGAQQTLANGATTEVLVGGGASALPVWTTATGTGAPVRATSPTLVTPALGTPSSGTLTNCTFPTLNQNTTGSAATLTTTRTIGGSNFNGSANVTSFPVPGAIGGTTPSTIAATSLACPTFTSSAAMGFTPTAGSSFSVTLSGAGDLVVNTNHLVVDTSEGFTGFGTTTPQARIEASRTASGTRTVTAMLQNPGAGLNTAAALGFNFGTTTGKMAAFIAAPFISSGAGLEFATGGSGTSDGTVKLTITEAGNFGFNTTSFGSSAAGVVAIKNGTEPSSSPADMVQLYSVDLSAGNATLGLRTETAVATEGSPLTNNRSLSIRINGTTYKVMLSV